MSKMAARPPMLTSLKTVASRKEEELVAANQTDGVGWGGVKGFC